MVIGVIGVGVVGGAVLKAFSTVTETVGYDLVGVYHDELNWDKIVNKSDVAFVCVPSPTIDNKQDLRALEAVIKRLTEDGFKGVVCIKCTVIPGTTDRLREESGLRITHNPEFLTAAKPYEDFMSQKAIIIGGPEADAAVVAKVYNKVFPFIPCSIYPSKVTEVSKYMRNNFLAVKVTFANEFYELCKHLDCEYPLVREAMLSQGGIESGHWKVPGPDGKTGYGLGCLPKDTRALNTYLLENGLKNEVLNAAVTGNESRREFDRFCREVEVVNGQRIIRETTM